MSWFKQMLSLVLVLALVFSLAACGTDNAPSSSDPSEPTSSEEVSEESSEEEQPVQPDPALYSENGGIDLTVADGNVTITWPESEAEGASFYGVFRASSRYGEYEELTYGLDDTTYTDAGAAGENYYYKVQALNSKQEIVEESNPVSEETLLFGDNVYILSPDDDPTKVQFLIDKIQSQQERAEFGKGRYAILLKPGMYDDNITLKQGYYMTYAGLGEMPTDVNINMLMCSAEWNRSLTSGNNALINFWRGAENMQVRGYARWAVSQAAYLRRVQIDGSVDFHDSYGWASGGFFADSVVADKADTGSQQQWLSRNCAWGQWSGQVWNMVFVGIEEGDAPKGTWPQTKYTTVDETPIVREKPFLIWDESEGYQVFVPALRENSSGASWVDGTAEGTALSLDEFYIAKAGKDTAATINAALAEGKNLLLTPGIYSLDEAIQIDRADTVVLGMGLANLVPTKGNACMEIADVDGVVVAGVLFDTGHEHSEYLLRVGTEDGDADHSANPICLSDCFFRAGGASNQKTSADCCLKIYANNTIGDNFWVWRADHGNGVGWDKNLATNGILVYGDDVTCYGLFVEHFQEHNTIWYGEGGEVYFYQSEIAYDIPDQESWTCPDGTLGYCSFKVDDSVKTFEAWGLGIYSNFWYNGIVLENGMEVPQTEGVVIHNVCSVALSGKSVMQNVINDQGGRVIKAAERKEVTLYGGEAAEG